MSSRQILRRDLARLAGAFTRAVWRFAVWLGERTEELERDA